MRLSALITAFLVLLAGGVLAGARRRLTAMLERLEREPLDRYSVAANASLD
jgi:hypothetical protein